MVLEATELLRSLIELQVPELLLLNALRVFLEVLHQVLDFPDLSFGIGVNDLRQVLHEAEVRSHGISQAGQLAELRDQGNFLPGASVLVDKQWLVEIADVLVVARLVVLTVSGRGPVLVKSGLGALREVHAVDLVGLLVVPSHDRGASECILDRFLAVAATLLSLVSQLIHVVEAIVSAHNFEADVYVKQNAFLLQNEPRVEAGPNFDVVGVEAVGIGLVEALLADGLKLEAAHHRVEEDLKEVQVVFVSLLHHLDPLDGQHVLGAVVLCLELGQFSHLLE